MELLILAIVTIVMMAIGVPIGISIAAGLISTALLFDTTTLTFIAQQLYTGLDSFALLAVPGFMLAGSFMEKGGLSKRLVNVAEKVVGHQTGGFCAVTVVACLFFGAISGSSPATVAAIGGIMIPYMVREGYSKEFATGLSAVSGSLGIIIPPSIPFVIYGIATNSNIGTLFIAGFGPGIMIGIALIVVSRFICKKRGYLGTERKSTGKEKLQAINEAKWALIMPLIILGGIYGGIFTPTEAAAVAIFYSLFVGLFVYKELKWKDVFSILDTTASFVGAVMLAFAPAAALGAVLSMLGVPGMVSDLLLSISSNIYVIMFIVMLVLIVAGMILDTISAIVLLAPILSGALIPMGIDPIHLGTVMIVALAIGFVTPPVAQNLFVASGMTGLPMHKIVKEAFPFIVTMLVCLVLITFFPEISLALPTLLS